jgi:large subunit ribosomal protein L24
MSIKKGDQVLVISGSDKGKKGKVLRVLAEEGRLVVEGINVAKKHQRATQKFQGGIIEKPLPLKASKVMLICPRCSQPTRLKKPRVCRQCQVPMDREK